MKPGDLVVLTGAQPRKEDTYEQKIRNIGSIMKDLILEARDKYYLKNGMAGCCNCYQRLVGFGGCRNCNKELSGWALDSELNDEFLIFLAEYLEKHLEGK